MTSQAEELRQYNRWRRGDDDLPQPNPKELGELLDSVADRLEVLERESVESFERWHDERRKRERLEIEIEKLRRGEFICQKCGLRKNDEHPKTHEF